MNCPGGVLAFDISSPWKLKHTLGNNFFGEDRGDIAYLWSNRYDGAADTVTMDLTFFLKEDSGLYRRFDEVHVQKAHAPEHLVKLLEQNGFTSISVFGDKTFDPPEADAQRVHIAAIRE